MGDRPSPPSHPHRLSEKSRDAASDSYANLGEVRGRPLHPHTPAESRRRSTALGDTAQQREAGRRGRDTVVLSHGAPVSIRESPHPALGSHANPNRGSLPSYTRSRLSEKSRDAALVREVYPMRSRSLRRLLFSR